MTRTQSRLEKRRLGQALDIMLMKFLIALAATVGGLSVITVIWVWWEFVTHIASRI